MPVGGHLCDSYRVAHHRSCRERTSILDSQKGRREAQQRTYTQTPRTTTRKTNHKRKRRPCARTHVADGEQCRKLILSKLLGSRPSPTHMRVGVPLDMISSTSSTPPIFITITNTILVNSTCNHCAYHPRMKSRKTNTLRMHCTAAVRQLPVSAAPLFIFISSLPCTSFSTNALYSPYNPFPAHGRDSRVSELLDPDDVCSGWDGVLSLAARDRTQLRDLRRLYSRLGRCVCKLCTDACCCIEDAIDQIRSDHRPFRAAFCSPQTMVTNIILRIVIHLAHYADHDGTHSATL